jgi:hypothetical protein
MSPHILLQHTKPLEFCTFALDLLHFQIRMEDRNVGEGFLGGKMTEMITSSWEEKITRNTENDVLNYVFRSTNNIVISRTGKSPFIVLRYYLNVKLND